MLIPIAPGVAFDPRELEESFIRASGPGGQNVNKVSSAVQVRLDLRRAGSLPEKLRARVVRIGGHLVTDAGVLIITAQRFRSQDRNRQDALDRLLAVLRQAARPVAIRRPTMPTHGDRLRRLEGKLHRGSVKRLRGRPVES